MTGHTVLWSPVRLSPVELAVCWSHLGLGALPRVLDPAAVQPRDSVREVLTGLRGRGVAPRGGQLERQLRTLAGGECRIDSWQFLDEPVRLRAALSGPVGVLAVLRADHAVLVSVPHYAVPGQLLAGLAPVDPAPLPPVSVRATALDEADRDHLAAALAARGEPRSAAERCARALRDAGHHGRFAVTAGGRRSGRVVAFHDTGLGRLLVLRGPDRTTCLPADRAAVAAAIAELVDETRGSTEPLA
ncbi:ESX secretion-associated protein EspG [Saccharothrix coeruleofusca]|uniref:ESAT-6 protein secretion system EspG family protein n=1 Tax=Saccharothrix coeruleofusca TaxID=33919 RepID=A0A918AF84_9PSEU|nr:ESX secretion-associated protein EspG [Saccharothrix coeruleofusca]MBP2340600.1 hypothetical protein [Saccharothrix coeruleofusca]GGP34373.1 hypothetical protein GCM10010185_01200 [Saccharothrix coeruleofusca]